MNIYLIIFSLQLQQDRSQMISMLTGSARKFNFQNRTCNLVSLVKEASYVSPTSNNTQQFSQILWTCQVCQAFKNPTEQILTLCFITNKYSILLICLLPLFSGRNIEYKCMKELTLANFSTKTQSNRYLVWMWRTNRTIHFTCYLFFP